MDSLERVFQFVAVRDALILSPTVAVKVSTTQLSAVTWGDLVTLLCSYLKNWLSLSSMETLVRKYALLENLFFFLLMSCSV